MTDELTAEKVEATFKEVIPDDTPPGPKRYHLNRDSVAVVAELGFTGLGHTYLETLDEDGQPVRIDVSNICNFVEIISHVGDTTKIMLGFTALPFKIRAIGVLDILDYESPIPDANERIKVEPLDG